MPRTMTVSSPLGSLPHLPGGKSHIRWWQEVGGVLESPPPTHPPAPISTVITYEPASPEEEMSPSLPDDLENNGKRPLSSDSSGSDEEAHVTVHAVDLN